MRWAIGAGSLLAILLWLIFPRHAGREHYSPDSAALRAIQTIHTAQVQYSSQYGRYAISLAELGAPSGGATGPSAADLIGSDLANGTRQGYKFTLRSSAGGYVVNANPVNYGTDGNKTFYSDQTMAIHENDGPEPASEASRTVAQSGPTTMRNKESH